MGKIPVKEIVCCNCFHSSECEYRENEGINLSHFISTDSGDCRLFKPIYEVDLIPFVGNNKEEDSNLLNGGFIYK